ncbi:TonB-dependent receptor [Colwellia sp. 6M3]|jgi:iron complex outermembrane receptor protein|uniref:TonB-dependent receptor plug domain-containing protein n=1 Tax=Colwellia sp. 6M3 TaxID=2759849 RepID=UPI0015F5415B|nr:TonB-dependent receptor [Colwellia sp. 6M3]MBA6417692.1 TonB-dependent receptor [Colwellia sp. 6M3]|tara:strand:- start:1364 stop:3931 length:2568 start_codon:yes stop_codon:yes gene_type:complete
MSTTFRTGTLALAVGLALGTAPSFAAGFAEEAAKKESVERIAVIGSRSAPRSVAESPVPIDIIGGDELGKNASSDMLDMLVGAIPSLNARAQPISDAASLIRPVNLRGLPSDSTLVLLNGKRRHRASVIAFQGGGINDGAQGPDISVIPSVAIKQVEVLRDGAAAQYGSDAIAGVMNFVLKDDADGGSISVKQGSYYEGDGDQTIVDGNIGLPFTKDGFVNLSFQLKNADATSRSVQRPDAQGIADAGNTSIQDPAQIWGNPEVKDDITLFGNVGLDLGDDKEFYMFGNYSERDVTGGFYYRNPHNRGNVYSVDGGETLLVGDIAQSQGAARTCAVVPANVPNVLDTTEYQAMVADPNCFSMNQIFPGGYTPQFGGNITDTSLTVGTKGDINSGMLEGWYFDVSGSVGRNESKFNLKNTLNPSLGLETPVDFDTGSYIQMEKTFNFDLVKGFEMGLEEPVNVATGLEWREESFEIVSGEESSWKAGAFADQGFNIGSHGFKGFGPETQGRNDRRNIAAYVDVEAQLTEDFLLGAAVRYEDFTTFGNTTNYKLTAQYTLNDEFSFRASHSTGFRAPTVGQANVVNTQTSLVMGDLIQTFLAPPTNPLSAFYGGKELAPEESRSFAGGMVYQEGDFFFTLDYYNIEVTDRLAQSSQIDVEPADYAELEALGVVNPELISAVTYFANDFDTTTQGVDIVANYSMELLDGDTLLSLAYNWNETTVDKFNPDTTDEGKVHRLEEGMPDHRATFTISQTWDSVTSFVRVNYFGEYFATHADDTCAIGCWNEIADSAITLDAEVSYFVNDSITLSVGANNLFDQEAQKLPEESYGQLGAEYYESGPFDYNGGFYYVKATYNF